jgi:hypothetical protein
MSMKHKAFVFDYAAFKRELKGLIEKSLVTGETAELAAYVEEERSKLTDPSDGRPLSAQWAKSIPADDPQAYGLLALTKFYDAGGHGDIGLGYEWSEIDDVLEREAQELQPAPLGRPVGQPPHYFDPGKMGSYFQTPALVKQNLAGLRQLLRRRADLEVLLKPVVEMLDKAASQDKGLYVHF